MWNCGNSCFPRMLGTGQCVAGGRLVTASCRCDPRHQSHFLLLTCRSVITEVRQEGKRRLSWKHRTHWVGRDLKDPGSSPVLWAVATPWFPSRVKAFVQPISSREVNESLYPLVQPVISSPAEHRAPESIKDVGFWKMKHLVNPLHTWALEIPIPVLLLNVFYSDFLLFVQNPPCGAAVCWCAQRKATGCVAWSSQNLILLESWSWKKIGLCKHEGDDRDAGSVTPLHVVIVNVFILFFLCFNNKRAGIDLYTKFHLEAQNCLRLFIVIWFCLHLHCLHLPKGSPAYPDGFTTIPHKDFLFTLSLLHKGHNWGSKTTTIQCFFWLDFLWGRPIGNLVALITAPRLC